MSTITPTIKAGDRHVQAEFVVSKIEHGHVLAVLSVTHNKNRKRLSASLYQVRRTREPGDVFTVDSFWLFHGINIGVRPIARWNRNQARAYLEELIPQVLASTDPAIQAVLTEPERDEP